MEISLNSFVAGYSIYQTPHNSSSSEPRVRERQLWEEIRIFFPDQKAKVRALQSREKILLLFSCHPLSAYQYLGLGVSGSRNLYYPFHSLATEHTPWHFSSFPRMATLASLLFQTNTQLLLTPLTLTFLLLSKCSFPSWSSWLVPSAPQSHLLKDTFSRCLI